MEVTKIRVVLEGLSDIMFDRFIDHSQEVRPPEQKIYLNEKGEVVLPAENMSAFYFGENPSGCAKWFEGKKGKDYIRMGMSHVFFGPTLLPFQVDGKPIAFNGFENGRFSIYWASGRTKKGTLSIKQEMKARPLMKLPWELEFLATIIKNSYIDETKLHNWTLMGGMQIAVGTYRPRFGRFGIKSWEVL